MRQLRLTFVAVYRDLEPKVIPQVKMMPSRSCWFEGENWEIVCYLLFMQFPLTRTIGVSAYLISKFSVAVLIRGQNLFQTKGKESYFYKSFYKCAYF